MQNYSLTIDRFLDHAAKWFPEGGVVESTRRMSYRDLHDRANRMSGALLSLGLGKGDRVATLAWNTRHHIEMYYAIMGVGIVCHTLNPRLTVEHLVMMITEAEDQVLAVAADLLPIARELARRCNTIRQVIVMDQPVADLGDGELLHDELLDTQGKAAMWGAFEETSPAGLCYTSGTTGNPKGVIYTHRSNYLHTLRALQADAVALTGRDALMLAVPMFHANGWGLPFAAPAVGAKLVLPGRFLDGSSLTGLMRAEGVTVAAGVQTVWLGVADHLEASGTELPELKRILIGGSHCPESLLRRLERVLGAEVQTSWGMTELSPIGTIAPPGLPSHAPRGSGRPPIGVDLKLTDADGVTLPRQRETLGHLKVRGHSVLQRYFKSDDDAVDADGYFDTGDLAIIDTQGNLTISGRSKDLIKSGGEWINPTDIESIVGTHPNVRHVAVIARPDRKWGERPVLIVEANNEEDPRKLVDLLRGKVADWWLPDQVATVQAMPLAATGKIDKQRLRADFARGEIETMAVSR